MLQLKVELKEILFSRTKFAFFDYSLDKDVVPLCAAFAFKKGSDLRVAFSVLLKAGRLAEKKNSKSVSVEHIRASFSEKNLVKDEILQNLSQQEKDIINTEIFCNKNITKLFQNAKFDIKALVNIGMFDEREPYKKELTVILQNVIFERLTS